jgi:hypothetical protein
VRIEQRPQCQEGLDTPARLRRITHVATGKRLKHPSGNGNLEALLERDDQMIRGLAPQPADNLHGLAKAGMMGSNRCELSTNEE